MLGRHRIDGIEPDTDCFRSSMQFRGVCTRTQAAGGERGVSVLISAAAAAADSVSATWRSATYCTYDVLQPFTSLVRDVSRRPAANGSVGEQ